MITEKITAIEKLMNENDEAAAKLNGLKDPAVAIAVLAEYGISVSEEEFAEMVKLFSSDELPAELLDMVAGGRITWRGVGEFFRGFCDGFYEGTVGLFNKR